MNRMKKIRIGLSFILVIFIGVFIYELVLYNNYSSENKRLVGLKNEYELLTEEIKKYEELKNNYLIVLEEEKGLKNNYSSLELRVEELNKDVNNLKNNINNIKKKIDDIS